MNPHWRPSPVRPTRHDGAVTDTTLEAEGYIQFRLSELSSRNEHHRFEEIATRIARKRISANILVATGPVSSGGDQGRDGETYTTRIPDELPHSAGFSASASTAPVVLACTVQNQKLKQKVLEDLAAICSPDADPVAHVAYFSVHAISEGITHELKRIAREKYRIGLDIFCGADIATFLSEPDLVWVAQHYLDLPAALVPPPESEPAPEWYAQLLEKLRQNKGPAALTPATQGEITQGLRFATWDEDFNADLPEWIDYMGAFLTDTTEGDDDELVFRSCYEIAVARFRGTGNATAVEALVRRAIGIALVSTESNVVDDAVTLASYWAGMWSSGAGRAEAGEIVDAVLSLAAHAADLLERTDEKTHPVRAASLTGTLAFAHLVPNLRYTEQTRGRPELVDVAPHAGISMDDLDLDTATLDATALLGATVAMDYLEKLVDLLPGARVYSARQLARVFTLFAPILSEHPAYAKVRDGLDTATADVLGQAATASRCRDRGMAFVRAGRPLAALVELHNAKANWFTGDTLYGAVLTMRFIGKLYSDLRLPYAAKMYACAAAAVTVAHGEGDMKDQLPTALLEVAQYAHLAGCWSDAAALTEIALLARAQYLPEPFDFDADAVLESHRITAALGLSAVRKYWPSLEPLISEEHPRTGWFEMIDALVATADVEQTMSEARFQEAASKQLAGPVFADIGPLRIIDFEALGVRWIFRFTNDRATVLAAEGLVAAFQVFIADIAPYSPVLIPGSVTVRVRLESGGASEVGNVVIDRSKPVIAATVALFPEFTDSGSREASIAASCFQLLEAVHARPSEDLMAFMEPMFSAGLVHKLAVGRPYEEAADLLDDDHYGRCVRATRPVSSEVFRPAADGSLGPSHGTGTGYVQEEALGAIRERYEVASVALRYTLPRLLANDACRASLMRMRDAGWLDWQILVVLVNAVWNWRMVNSGIRLETVDRATAIGLARAPETAESPRVPFGVFSESELSFHSLLQTQVVAKRWGLQGRQEEPGEEAMRDLLTRRYRYADDDVSHNDLFDCVDERGALCLLPLDDDESVALETEQMAPMSRVPLRVAAVPPSARRATRRLRGKSGRDKRR